MMRAHHLAGRFSLALVFLLAWGPIGVALPASLGTQETPATITGSVTDTERRPMGDAIVELRGPVERSALTDGEGRCAVEGLPAAAYGSTRARSATARPPGR